MLRPWHTQNDLKKLKIQASSKHSSLVCRGINDVEKYL
jgi:hypothetical protein